MTSLFVCKYKLHVFYVAKGESAPNWIRPVLFASKILSCIAALSVNVVGCSKVEDDAFQMYNIIITLVVTIIIMIFSAVLLIKINLQTKDWDFDFL